MAIEERAAGGVDFGAIESAIGLNWYDADPNLQMLVERLCPAADRAFAEAKLRHMGGVIGGPVAARAEITDKNPPQLEKYDAWGNEVNRVIHHQSALDTKRDLWENGFLSLRWSDEAKATSTGRLPAVVNTGYLYFLNQAETGMACGIGMTSSAAGIINKHAPPDVRERFLHHLTTNDWAEAWDGGMFLTEIRAGSDLAAAECSARKTDDGWRIDGSKWFCSNLDAQTIMVLARPEGAPLGLATLLMFLVPQRRSDGTRNGIHIRRLKDKLGTKAVPTGEIDFVDAEAYLMGREPGGDAPVRDASSTGRRGINRMMEMVQSSRFGVAVMGLGIMRRSFVEAAAYAHHREAFGRLLIEFPLVRETLVNMAVEVEAGCALVFEAAEAGARRDDESRRLYRLLVPLAKYRCARRGLDLATQAVEVYGGNGYIESWPVARQFRDAMCHPIWEGTENIICLDVLRAMQKEHADEALFSRIEQAVGGAEHPALSEAMTQLGRSLDEVRESIAYLQGAREDVRLLHARRLTDYMADVTQAALLMEEAAWELAHKGSARKAVVARQFVETHLAEHTARGIMSPNRIPLDHFEAIVGWKPVAPGAV